MVKITVHKKHPFLKKSFKNPYQIGDKIQFFNRFGNWIDGTIIGFNIKSNRYQAIIKCSNPECKLHKICIYSLNLKKVY